MNDQRRAPMITAVSIDPDPTMADFGLAEPKVVSAMFDNGTTATLFSYFSDELHIDAAELVGLTEDEARHLHHRRDVDWLQT